MFIPMSATNRKLKKAVEESSPCRDQYEALLARGLDEHTSRELSGYQGQVGSLPTAPLSLWTHDELRELARRSGIRNPKSLSRDELIQQLSEAEDSSTTTSSDGGANL